MNRAIGYDINLTNFDASKESEISLYPGVYKIHSLEFVLDTGSGTTFQISLSTLSGISAGDTSQETIYADAGPPTAKGTNKDVTFLTPVYFIVKEGESLYFKPHVNSGSDNNGRGRLIIEAVGAVESESVT